MSALKVAMEQFLFAPVRSKTAAIFRIYLAGLVMLVFWPLADARLSMLVAAWVPSVSMYESVFFGQTYWICLVLLLTGMAAGVQSRACGIAAAILLIPLVPVYGRLPGRFMLWMSLAAISLIRSDVKWRLGRAAIPGGVSGPMWPIRLIQIQVSVLYGVNAMAKMSIGYLNGGALAAMSAQLPNFQVDLSGGVFPLFGIEIPLALAAVASVCVEGWLAIGLWFRRTRWVTALLGVTFHLSLLYVVSIGMLDVVAVGLYAAFLIQLEQREEAIGIGSAGPLY